MIGPRMLLLMLLPTAVGLAAVLAMRGRQPPTERIVIRGVWLLIPVLAVTVAARTARGLSEHDHAINRLEGALVLAASAVFVLLNVDAIRGRLATCAVLFTGIGGAMNATAALIFGGIPVLQASARVAGYSFAPGSAPPPDYVFSDQLGVVAIAMGDFIPVPGFLKVLSIGDLLLFSGLVALVIVASRNASARLDDSADVDARLSPVSDALARDSESRDAKEEVIR